MRFGRGLYATRAPPASECEWEDPLPSLKLVRNVYMYVHVYVCAHVYVHPSIKHMMVALIIRGNMCVQLDPRLLAPSGTRNNPEVAPVIVPGDPQDSHGVLRSHPRAPQRQLRLSQEPPDWPRASNECPMMPQEWPREDQDLQELP